MLVESSPEGGGTGVGIPSMTFKHLHDLHGLPGGGGVRRCDCKKVSLQCVDLIWS